MHLPLNSKAVIFDLDGVIINSEPIHAEATRLVMQHFDVDISLKELATYVGSTAKSTFIDLISKYNLQITPEEFADQKRGFFMDALEKTGKPDPEVFTRAAALLNLPPEDCIVIEDSRMGTLAARAAGIKCIGYQNPSSGNQDLSAADFIIKNFDEIF